MKRLFEEKGITLIALTITIILMLILSAVVLILTTGENGIINKAKQATKAHEEAQAREKLEVVLLDLQANKVTDEAYNETEYINTKIKQNGMTITGDIVSVDGWDFEIDRTVPKIASKQEENDNKSKCEIIYVGDLNMIKGNFGVVTTTFDIKNIYENYSNLTIDNFVYQISYTYDHWETSANRLGGTTLTKSYDSKTGILTINNAYQVARFNSGIAGKVYLIPEIEQIK